MKEISQKTLRIVAITCSFFGLFLLFLISQTLDLQETKIGEITVDDLGKTVRVCGRVEQKFVSQGGHTFFDLRDKTGKIKVVVFNKTAYQMQKFKVDLFQLKNEDGLCLVGEVNEWKYELEIITKKIELK